MRAEVEGSFLIFAGIVMAGAVLVVAVLGRADRARTKAPVKDRLRRGTGQALLGLQQLIEPSVEHVLAAEDLEQEEDDHGPGGDEEAVRSDLAEALGRSPVDAEEVRRHLSAAARAGLDGRALYEQAAGDELRERPFRVPSMPPARRVKPRE
jgi:hypothetical protein